MVPEGAAELPPQVEGAVSALVALGFSFSDADTAVRRALKEDGDLSSQELIKRALAGQ
jgi:Holliday junction resolvasome RuvABC DNA-binding subunit